MLFRWYQTGTAERAPAGQARPTPGERGRPMLHGQVVSASFVVALLLLATFLFLVTLQAGCIANGANAVTGNRSAMQHQSWRRQTLSLTVSGYVLRGDKLKQGDWQGTGVWVAPGLMATNTHVVLRALRVRGKDDTGRTFEFDRLYVLDVKNDLAILGEKQGAKNWPESGFAPMALATRPRDPRDLRTTEVISVGNTAGLGLSVYQGRIVNVQVVNGVEKLIHDTSVSLGASGGPLFRASDWALLGINHGINSTLRFSFAIPAWTLQDAVTLAKHREGKPILDVFQWSGLLHVPVETLAQGSACLKPGEGLEMPLHIQGETDVVYAVVPEKETHQIGVALTQGEAFLMSDLVRGATSGAFTVLNAGQVKFLVGNVEAAGAGPICIKAVAARVAWERRLEENGPLDRPPRPDEASEPPPPPPPEPADGSPAIEVE